MKAKNILMLIVVCQYVPRLIRIRPLYLQITRSAGIITETAWAGAAFNLIIYMLASHVSAMFINFSIVHNLSELCVFAITLKSAVMCGKRPCRL
jgi:hypothetical protein